MTLSRAAAIGPRIAALALVSLTAGVAHAQGRFAISADGHEVTDSVSHLVWHRCVEGMHWDGKACSGKAATFSYAEAKKAATAIAQRESKAWRIPAREELVALVDMTTKKKPRDRLAGVPADAREAVLGDARRAATTTSTPG